MNLDEVRADTRQAYIEAGIEEPDLEYITQEFLDDLESNPEASEPPNDTGESAGAETSGDEAVASWGSLYYDVVFVGLAFYGTIGGDRYVCNGNWGVKNRRWSQRVVVGRCNNRNSLIWRIG